MIRNQALPRRRTLLYSGAIIFLMSCLLTVVAFGQFSISEKTGKIPDFKYIPQIKWEFRSNAPIYSSPVFSESLVFIGGLDSILHAIDFKSGEEVWKFHCQGEIRSTPAMGLKSVFLNGGDGTVYSLEKSSGKVIWKFKMQAERKYDFADYFQSSPVLEEDALFLGSGDGNFYALDAKTGMLKWKFQTGDVVHTTAAIGEGRIYFGSFDGYVYALNASTGELIWKFKTVGHMYFPKGEVQGSPAFFKDLVFIGARDYNVYAIDKSKGFCHWNKAFTNGSALCNNVHDSIFPSGRVIAHRMAHNRRIFNH